uniref:Uncharacterized protein n=1 Tax=Myotis myotis TaxID=51298 RepID=A0A7J7WWN0_MYOMY|nr:hypothetical protein mMyoMyo1_011991 [Myotis myotis]
MAWLHVSCCPCTCSRSTGRHTEGTEGALGKVLALFCFLQCSLKWGKTSKLGNFSRAKMAQPPRRANRVSSRPCPARLGHLIHVGCFSSFHLLVLRLFHNGRMLVCVCVCVCVCKCVCGPAHSSIKLGDDESRIFPPAVKVMGPHNPGRGRVGV